MNKIVLSTITSAILTSMAYAGGDIVQVEPKVEAPATTVDQAAFFKTVDGYLRAGYQYDKDTSDTDLALGGKLHVETQSWNGLSVGASFYTTNQLGKSDGAGVPFFDSNNDSYSILGEAYVQGQWGKTTIKIGRQEIDTPFADTDDIGMVPNTFEAGVLVNKDIADTTIVLAQVQKMAGVDAPVPEKFTKINGDNNVQLLGVTYEGIEGLALSAWYYNLKDFAIDKIAYVDANYEGKSGDVAYAAGLQYASQNYSAAGADSAKIWGATASIGYEPAGLTVTAAYNKSNDNAADNGFGGGPFFTSAEHLTLAEAGVDGEVVMFGAEFDASSIGAEGLTLAANIFTLADAADTDSTELDLTASYAFNDNFSVDVIYSDVDDDINADEFKNTRVFVNYTF